MNDIEWYTPDYILEKVYRVFGKPIGCDPCAARYLPSRIDARTKYIYPESDGLSLPWHSCTFVNPPYGRDISKWTAKAVSEYKRGVRIILLVPAKTDTKWFKDLIRNSNAACFIEGRVKFIGPDGNVSGSGGRSPTIAVLLSEQSEDVMRFGQVFGEIGTLFFTPFFRTSMK